MGVAVEMAVSGVDRNYATGAGNRAAHVLELHGRVMNMKAVVEYVINPMEDVIAL